MATQPAQTANSSTASQPFAKGSIIWQKKGPLPVWAWALILLGIVLAWSVWRRNKADADATEADLAYVDELPGDQTAPPVFVIQPGPQPPVNVNVTAPITTVPSAPPGGGRVTPPTVPRPYEPPTAKPKPPPAKAPKPAKPKPAAPGRVVTVTKWPDNTPPKESTLWDIAAHYLGKGNLWPKIWNDPRNAAVKKRRGVPERIQAGDKFFVPGAK